jgi:hypothetical protein
VDECKPLGRGGELVSEVSIKGFLQRKDDTIKADLLTREEERRRASAAGKAGKAAAAGAGAAAGGAGAGEGKGAGAYTRLRFSSNLRTFGTHRSR